MVWDFGKYQQNTAFIDEFGKSLTYKDLIEDCSEIKSVIKERCLVFCMCTNTIGSVVGYCSFVNNSIVAILLNAHIEKELFENLYNIYKPKFVWMPSSLIEENGFDASTVVFNKYNYSLLKSSFDIEIALFDGLCILLTTSGSTGSPKFVRQSYLNVIRNAKSIVDYLHLDETERPITTLPMNYTYGLSIINSHLMVGATILLTDKGIMQKEFWQFFKEQNATSFGGVPYTYEMLDKLRFMRMDLPSLKYMTQAGGKITVELHQKFAEYAKNTNKQFIVMYGQCEATARMGYLPPKYALEKIGSMGIPIPGGRFVLIDDNNQIINQPNTSGELEYYGENVTLGYAECIDDLAKGDERGGVLKTGDIAEFDSDGFYYIVGRKKRFLKIYGNRVNLDEIDRLIKSKFENIDVACTGKDDHLYIFITDERYSKEILDYISFKTRLNSSAFKVIVISSIPKNDSGKVLYKELIKYYES